MFMLLHRTYGQSGLKEVVIKLDQHRDIYRILYFKKGSVLIFPRITLNRRQKQSTLKFVFKNYV